VGFEGVLCQHQDADMIEAVEERLESCYDWGQIMGLVLGTFASYTEPGWLEEQVARRLAGWLAEPAGWGLLFTLLSPEVQQHFLLLHSQLARPDQPSVSNSELFVRTRLEWEEETQLSFLELVPRLTVQLQEVLGGALEHERRKVLLVTFSAPQFTLEVVFSVYRKAAPGCLVAVAAEAVARALGTRDPAGLEIPRVRSVGIGRMCIGHVQVLKEVARDKVIDACWVESYRVDKVTFEMLVMQEEIRRKTED
jgi:hypothetical protein